MLGRKQHLVSSRRLDGKVVGGQGSEVRGYLLCSREGMVETGHISHYGFLIWTSSVHNVYKGKTVVMRTYTYRQDRGHACMNIHSGIIQVANTHRHTHSTSHCSC